MKIRRDVSSNAAPSPDQLEVGELAINAKTGILYSKLVDGTIIKWLGSPVCASSQQAFSAVPVPEITIGDINNFCCNGDSLRVTVSNLLVNHRYICTAMDLMNNSTTTIAPISSNLTPVSKSDRSTIFNLNINKDRQNIALLKLSIYEIVEIDGVDTNLLRSEKLTHIQCKKCPG